MGEKKAEVIAFYLPQFHPIPENDKWWGKGFTEWTNVGSAKPLFKGHYQPRIPADLGYYDLRLPEVREQQSELAKEAGISAFCYYHYWFGNGKQLLEMPLNEVVRLGKPDFPFCICWANHSWYRKNWNPKANIKELNLIVEQTYPGRKDYIEHFYAIYNILKDKRYYRINDRLLFMIYKVQDFPDIKNFKECWQDLAKINGLPSFYFIGYADSDDISNIDKNNYKYCDAVALSLLESTKTQNIVYRVLKSKLSKLLNYPFLTQKYSNAIKNLSAPIFEDDRIYPVIIPNWDYTPRLNAGGLIYKDSTPELFKQHVKQVLHYISNKSDDNKIIFLKSWNEWGEGNYMEPDIKFGKGYIRALRDALT